MKSTIGVHQKNSYSGHLILLLVVVLLASGNPLQAQNEFVIDSRHYSNVFGEVRNYRIILPPDYYDAPEKRYPVVYYYHGWSYRYFGSLTTEVEENPDEPNDEERMAEMAAKYSFIVVKPDGYNSEPEEPYNLRPYNIGPVETYRQFPLYFPELVNYIDTKYRTLADRKSRAISGHSMGGFMTFWIAGKYPHLVSAAGSFCASPEFVIGPKDFPVEYYHANMYGNYNGVKLRHNYGDKDFIRAYHWDVNKIWLQVMDNYEKEVYDAGHDVCGLEDMFVFFRDAFEEPLEDPEKWHHIDVYPEFGVWGYQISTDRDVEGFTVLENVDINGFRSSVREFLPGGDPLPMVKLTVLTDTLYRKSRDYLVNIVNLTTKENIQKTLTSDEAGRLRIELNGGLHEIGIIEEGKKRPNISMVSTKVEGLNWASPNKKVPLSVILLNKGTAAAGDVKARLIPFRKSATASVSEIDYGDIEVNGIKEGASLFVFNVSIDTVEMERFTLEVTDRENNRWEQNFEISLKREHSLTNDFEIADGKTFTYASGGTELTTGELGEGNGDGIPNPGESIVILVKDNGKLWPASLYSSTEYLDFAGKQTRVSDYWGNFDHVGGSFKYNVPVISSECPPETELELFAEYWMPDYPIHIIRNGKISIKVSGTDQTAPQLSWMKVSGDNIIRAKFYDGGDVSQVEAFITSKDDQEKEYRIELNDEGKSGDRLQNDLVFSSKIEVPVFGMYQAKILVRDSFGNERTIEVPDPFILHGSELYHEKSSAIIDPGN